MFGRTIGRFLDAWPGKSRFGIYRFLPGFFALGALIEFTMIKLRVGNINFYEIYKRKHPELIIERAPESTGSVPDEIHPVALTILSEYEAFLQQQAKATNSS